MSAPLGPRDQDHASRWARFMPAVLSQYETEQAHENKDILIFHAGFIESRLYVRKDLSPKSATTSSTYSLLSLMHPLPLFLYLSYTPPTTQEPSISMYQSCSMTHVLNPPLQHYFYPPQPSSTLTIHLDLCSHQSDTHNYYSTTAPALLFLSIYLDPLQQIRRVRQTKLLVGNVR